MEPIQFGNFTLLERISHGGMAEVFRAKSFGEAGFEREVALKVLLPSMANDQEFVNMLIDEAKIAGQLNHANIAQIFDLGVTDKRYYIVQEYVKGQDLRAILKFKHENKSHLDIAKACYIALKVCEGLHYAHNKEDPSGRPLNLVHRDISPHNILISDEGEVKIIDFGIAKAEGRATQTMAGLVKGKFAYMSPEQIRGLPVDHRSDVFATGILLHEMLTTRALFRRSSEFETLKRARSAMAEPPSRINPLVPPPLDKIVLKALARHVDDRYQSAQEFRDALWSFAREHSAFDLDETTGDLVTNQDSHGSESSIEIEIASEVHAINNFVEGGNQLDGDLEADGEYEITVEGSEDTELADVGLARPDPSPSPRPQPAAALSPVHNDVDADDEDTENATMVDPKLPFGMPGMASKLEDEIAERTAEDFTPTDHDAQWAANAMSPYAMPSRSAPSPVEEETTNDRKTPAPSSHQFFDESTARKVPASERASTAPAMPKRPAASTSSMTAAMPAHSSFDEVTGSKPGPSAPAPSWGAPTNPVPRPGPSPASQGSPMQTHLGVGSSGAQSKAQIPRHSEPVFSQPSGSGPLPMPAPKTPQAQPPRAQPPRAQPPQAQAPHPFTAKTGAAPLGNMMQAPQTPITTQPYSPPHPGLPAGDQAHSRRIYLLMLSLFILLLAGAATITLVITD
jgi:serine/threonine-protein kinase